MEGDFLRSLAAELNSDYFGSYREYTGYNKEEMVDLMSNRLTVEEVDTVVSRYLLCHSPDEIAESIKPDETMAIKKKVEEHFGKNGVFEAKVGDRYCDIVFPDSLVAVEVKSARDNVKRALEQTDDYAVWADEVYLAYDTANEESVPNGIPQKGVGLLRYDEGNLEVEQPAETRKSSAHELLNCMTYEQLCETARDQEITTTGEKHELAQRLASELSLADVRSEFSAFVEQRGRLEI